MPYTSPDSPVISSRPRNHRRSASSNASFSDEKGPGAFVSLGALPKLQRKLTPKKTPTFHFRDDDEDDDDDESLEDTEQQFGRLSIDTQNLSPSSAVKVQPATPGDDETSVPIAVPFPVFSPTSPTPETPPLLTDSSRRPTLSRGSSHPILLSNGKPLKSSLKSSASSPSIPEDVRSLHMRVQSAPATPSLTKSVHFPDKKEDGLENVRVFNRTAKPLSVSTPGGDDTETETEQESRAFPFPRFGSHSSGPSKTPVTFEIDTVKPGSTSKIPAANPPAYANIHFESLTLSQPGTPSSPLAPSAPNITGSILVRNVAFEKHVAVRFTLDDWQTTSEVRARYVSSLPALPWEAQANTLGDAVGLIASAGNNAGPTCSWDRFAFNIRLEDHAYKLHERVLWFVGRYTATGEGGGEWWDNNSGANYRVGFRPVQPVTAKSREDTGRTVSAPEPVTKTATPKPTQRDSFGLGFEFPTTMAAPVPAAVPVVKPVEVVTSSASYPSPAPSPTTSTPPTILNRPNRPRGLSLKNYAAPSLSPTAVPRVASRSPLNSPPLSKAIAGNPFGMLSGARVHTPTPPITPIAEHPSRKQSLPLSAMPGWGSANTTPKASALPQTIIGGQPASAVMEPTFQGIALHWPWGLSASDSRSGTNSPGSGNNSPRHRFSPRNLSPMQSTTPANSHSGSPQTRSGNGTPQEGSSGESSSDDLYKAFVQQWCFAQSPSPSGPGPVRFPGVDGLAETVLVG